MKEIRNLFLIFFLLVIVNSCQKIQQISAVPHIDFTSFAIFDTTDILGNHAKGGRLKFKFEDGDGDVGLNSPNGNKTDSLNLFFTLYKKVNGTMESVADNDPLKPAPYRIPYLEAAGRNKILKGIISVTFLYNFYSPSDTISYDFYIRDRALNESNVVSTTEIIPAVNKVY